MRSSQILTSLFPLCGAFLAAAQLPASAHTFASYGQQMVPVRVEESEPVRISPEMEGDIMMARQRYLAALEQYRQTPMDSATLWNKVGIANHHLLNLHEAQRDYAKAIKMNPSYSEAWNNMGAVYYGQKDYHNAERAYKKAIKLNSKSATFYSNLGTAYMAERKFNRGAEAYRKALSLDPNVFNNDQTTRIVEFGPIHEMAEMYYTLAKTYASAGRKSDALYYLRKALNEGYNDKKKIMNDREFAIMHDMPEFKQLLTEKRD